MILGEIQSKSSLNLMIANYKFWFTFEISRVRVLENRADQATHLHQRFRGVPPWVLIIQSPSEDFERNIR